MDNVDQRGMIRPVDGDEHGEALCDIGAYERHDLALPGISLSGNRIAEATGPDGAVVTYDAPSATDDVDGPVPAVCEPLSGSTFPIGTTSVICTAQDKAGNDATASFTVTVVDNTPPVLSLPEDMEVETANPDGTTVMFAASGEDVVDGPLAVSCSPASGETFPVGVTTVDCSATDSAGNTESGSFTVTVRHPAALLDRVEALIRSLRLRNTTEKSLLTKVISTRQSLDKGSTDAACSQIADFLAQVADFRSAGKLTAGQAEALIAAATRFRDVLGC